MRVTVTSWRFASSRSPIPGCLTAAAGRSFFEQLIRDHLDVGRPESVSLIFDRRINRRTPGTWRTRVITKGVDPQIGLADAHQAVTVAHQTGQRHRQADEERRADHDNPHRRQDPPRI